MKLLKNSSYFQSLLVLMTLLITFIPSEGACDTFSDDFENTNLNWRQVGTSSGTFSTAVGSGGVGTSVRLVDTDAGFHSPKLAVNNARYYNLSSAVVQAEVLPNSATGGGGVGFGVYDDNGSDVCAGVVAGLGYANSSWYLIILDQNEYESELHTIAITPVTIDPNQFYLIELASYGGNLTATLTLDDASTISISGPQRLNIDVAGIGLWTQNGDFSFDNFSMTADPDNRYMVFNDVDIVTDTSSEDDFYPSWSHDSKKLAYKERDWYNDAYWNVWVKQVDLPGSPIQITTGSDNVTLFTKPMFSPDNTYVIFETFNSIDTWGAEQGIELKRKKADGTGEVEPVFSESGMCVRLSDVVRRSDVTPPKYFLIGTIAPCGYGGGQLNIFAIEIDESGLPIGTKKLLTNFSFPGYHQPADVNFDETCNRLVFENIIADTNADIYLLTDVQNILDGISSAPTDFNDFRLTRIAEGSNFQCLGKFSRDGSHVYYSEDVNGLFNWWYMQKNRHLPSIEMGENDPEREVHWEIFAVKLDAANQPIERFKLNYYRPYSQGHLDASPDGTKLVFFTNNKADGFDPTDLEGDGVWDADIYIVTLKTQEEITSSDGGVITDGSGTNLEIPPGSISEDTTISITTPFPGDIPSPSTLPEGMQSIALARMIDAESDTVEFDPGNPPILTIQYTDEEIAGLDEQSLQIFVYNEDIAAWEAICGEGSLPVCTRNAESNTISAPLPHLSMFCLSGHSDADSDGDGIPDYSDGCPSDPAKTDPGACGCGVADTDADGDGFMQCVDCNDNDISVKPGAVELCDGKDNDCDGMIDEGIYVLGGFQQPINPDGSSIFKLGRTIPVKIIIADCSGAPISTATVSIAVYKISGSIMGTEEELVVEASGSANTGNLFRYDDSVGQYIFNLGTKNLTKGTYKIYAVPDKGERYSVIFSLK